ncbi:tyrosine-type recombinase/integrase [Acidithiobacillus ferridurans]|uniref:tyrosine-type recombinase/integrase n=1 Tax=Acidithiobacillus ferridurans TaxID=1232575 RepID=UPI001C06AAC9|nr:site-specific integrase [Acidithiobacillus ferridurans]MBU2804052.1 tyrosine-type recombinase/integrase [Acidithiobacillus ferridurans]
MALTTRQVSTLKDGNHSDGDGLYLRVRNQGRARSWVFRWKQAGKVRELGLGSVDLRPLKEARELVLSLRKAIRDGHDPATILHPVEERRIPTFQELAQDTIEALRPGWRNAKHCDQWANTLRDYAYPVIGKLLPANITVDHILAILSPIWSTKTETATRLRQRIETVLDRAAVLGYRDRDRVNPASWKSNLEHLLPKAKKVAKRQHFAAVPYDDLPALMSKLREKRTAGALALRLIALTACRSGEIRGLQWSEIDLQAKTLTIPAERTKTGKPHTIPLSCEAVKILETAAALWGTDGIVFRGQRRGRQLWDVSVSKELHQHAPDATVHGLRSSFRDWAADRTHHSREVIEQCLSHAIGNVEGAYRRTDLLQKRRAVMDDWARFLGQKGKVIKLPAKR